MKKRVFALTLFFVTLSQIFNTPAQGGGAIFTNEYTQVAQTEAKALIIFDGKKETLFDSMTFNLNPLIAGSFAWIIPVPSKPEVELLKLDMFDDLGKLTSKEFTKNSLINKIIYFDISEEKNLPSEVFTRPIDIYDHKIFEPENLISDLEKWAYEKGYYLPKSSQTVLITYQERKWYFVALEVNAVHIEYSATDSLHVKGAHTYPIKITFDTQKIIYPLRLASIQEDVDSQGIPLSFDYGQLSENVLGEKDEMVDTLLSKQSINKFPRLPLDFTNLKIDLTVVADYKTEVPGFTTIFADFVSNKDLEFKDESGKSYLPLANKKYFLSRIYAYRPQGLLDDITINKTSVTNRVNPRISQLETTARVAILIFLLLMFFSVKKERIKKSV